MGADRLPRIAQVISTTGGGLGGAEKVALALIAEAGVRGWPQLVLNPFARTDRGLGDFDGGECETFPYERPPDALRARRWLGRRLRAFRPDLIHVHMLRAELAVASLRLPRDSRSILTHHHGRHLLSQGRRIAAQVDRLAGGRYDRVVAPCESTRRFLVDRYRYGSERVVRIDNGWSGTPADGLAKASRPTIICVANFRAQKNHRLLIDAFARVRERIPAASLRLLGTGVGPEGVGVGPVEIEAREHARRLGLDASIEFAGTSTDVWPDLARAHVFALASDYETGVPLALLEAMAAGLPVAAPAVGGIADVVEPDVSGLLAEPGAPDSLADRIVTLLRDENLRERIAAGGRRAATRLRMERCVAGYFELYEDVAGTPTAR